MSFISLIADSRLITMMSDSQGTDTNMIAVNHGIQKIHRVDRRLIGITGDHAESQRILARLKHGLVYDDLINSCVVLTAEYVSGTLRVSKTDSKQTLISFGKVYCALLPFDCKLDVVDMLKTNSTSIRERQAIQKQVNDLVSANSYSVDTYTQFEVLANE